MLTMALLTPDERVTLEAIRDTGMVSRERYAWAKEKGYAEPTGQYRYRLTREGFAALLFDANRNETQAVTKRA